MKGAGARSARRFRLLLIIGLMTVLALGSFWVREVMRRGINDSLPGATREDPDYFVEKFMFVKMSLAGNARYDISGGRLTHLPRSDSYEIIQPVLHNHGNPQSPMTMRAEKAIVDDGNSKVHMRDKVQVDRPQSAEVERFHMESDYLLILPDDDLMQTDRPVEITLGRSRITGVGMSLDNAKREFRMLNQTHGIYVATSQTEQRSAIR
jgi:lipopolysaccharide export system protein LptC